MLHETEGAFGGDIVLARDTTLTLITDPQDHVTLTVDDGQCFVRTTAADRVAAGFVSGTLAPLVGQGWSAVRAAMPGSWRSLTDACIAAQVAYGRPPAERLDATWMDRLGRLVLL